MRMRHESPILQLGILLALVGTVVPSTIAEEGWPPAPPLEPVAATEDAAPLPPSISAEAMGKGEWRCTFRFRPQVRAERVVLAGSFNSWDRLSHPMTGPDENGEWSTQIDLSTGVYQYKFLVDDERWISDPRNLGRVPDGFGNFNSFVHLGRLARMEKSEAQLGDGKVAALGLEHRPPLPLYVQPLDMERVSIRYRTFAHDVKQVRLAIKDGETIAMPLVSKGPLFSYFAADIAVPERNTARPSKVRSIDYTFVLNDGAELVSDPYTYHYSFTESGLFATPDWAKHAIWYQIMLDRFRNGDPGNDAKQVRAWTSEWFTPSAWEKDKGREFYEYVFDRSYGGDLDGLAEQLPYLKALGINALYLNPIFKSPSNHKYDVQSYIHVDDGFGTRGDYEAVAEKEDLLDPSTWQWTATDQRFLEFVKQAHEMGFRVILDGVFNHVGSSHPAFLDVLANGKQSRYADWFDITSWDPVTYKGWAGFEHMPVLRKNPRGFASPAVKDHIFSITRRWMDPNGDGDPNDGIDGWRLDVPNDIPRPFWRAWRTLVKKLNPDALITGEIWHRADQWLDGKHFDAVMNYQFAKVAAHWVFDREGKILASEAASRLAELRLAYPEAATYTLQNLVDSHDTDRLASMAQNPNREYDRQNRVQDNNPQYDNSKPAAAAYAKARLVLLFQMTYIGAPMIYYGDEAGMWGADDPTNRKPMLWKDLEPYDSPEGNVVMADQLAFYKQTIALRNEHPALRVGSIQTLLTDDAADVWAFVRSDDSEHMLVVLNASETPHEVRIPLPPKGPQAWKIVFGGTGAATATDGQLPVSAPAVGGVVLHAGQN